MFQRHPAQNDLLMFVTTNTHQRQPFFANPTFAREAVETLYRVQTLHPFFLYAFVIMPDHCHLLLRVPPPGSISKIIGSFKGGTSHNIGIGRLWQTRFDLRCERPSGRTLEYIHWNPVKAELAKNPEDYPWSSASGKWDVTAFEW